MLVKLVQGEVDPDMRRVRTYPFSDSSSKLPPFANLQKTCQPIVELVSVKNIIEAHSPSAYDGTVYPVVIKMVHGQHLVGGHALGFDLRRAPAEHCRETINEPHDE